MHSSQRLVLLLVVLSTLMGGRAHATAHHRNVVLQKLRGADGKVNGFRIHAILSPERYRLVRLNVGSMQPIARGNRLVAAGIQPGYVRAQLAEFDVTKMTGAGGLYEVKLDVRYGVGNNLNPGDKVDIYSTHSSMGGNSYWHVFGMFYGPVHTSDASHVHLLPSDTSAHAEASANP